MGSVNLGRDIHCQQYVAGGNVQIVCINEPLVDIQVRGSETALSDEELRTLGTAVMDAVEKSPALKQTVEKMKKHGYLEDVKQSLLAAKKIYNTDAGKAELFVDINKATNMICIHVTRSGMIQNGGNLLNLDLISADDIPLDELYDWCATVQIQTMGIQKEQNADVQKTIARLQQLINMTIDTNDYLPMRAKLYEYLRCGETPTYEGFLEHLQATGCAEYGSVLEQIKDSTGDQLVFYSQSQMYEYLSAGCDLYNPATEIYISPHNKHNKHNKEGAVYVYNLPLSMAERVAVDAREQGEPWSALLDADGQGYDSENALMLCGALCEGLRGMRWLDTDMFTEQLILAQDNDRDAIELD